MKSILALFLTALLVLSGCTKDSTVNKTELTISAAASLRDSLEEVGLIYMEQNPDIKLVFNFGGSGSLQQQISQGAPVDLFISAAEDKFQLLKSKQLITQDQSVKLLMNELVVITHKENKNLDSLESLTDEQVKRIAMGTPESVPAGMYAKQALLSLHLWERLEGKIILTKDVRQVLSYVETGNVDAGIVYKTDAMVSEKVRMVNLPEDNLHDPIIYPAGIIARTEHIDETMHFFNFLKGKEATEVFKKYGFKAALD